MDGNHSLLDFVSHLINSADVQTPLIINVVLGLPANMCVMWLILAGPGDKSAEIFSLNLAVCEVAVCMNSALSLIAMNITVSNVVNLPIFYIYIRFSWGLLFSGRPLFMGCICLERYLAIVHPVTFLKYKPIRYRLAVMIIGWLTVLVFSIILVWVPKSAIYYVTFSMSFTWFVVQLFCCVETLRALVKPGPGEGNQRSNGMSSAKLNAFRVILIIVVAMAISYLPYIVSVVLLGLISKEDSKKLFLIVTYIALINGFIPPLLYVHRAGKLHHCIKDAA